VERSDAVTWLELVDVFADAVYDAGNVVAGVAGVVGDPVWDLPVL